MRVSLQTNNFEKQIMNIAQYSIGFLDGVKKRQKNIFRQYG